MICVVLCGSKHTIHPHPKVGHWKFQVGRVSQKLKSGICSARLCVFVAAGGGGLKQNIFYVGGGDKNIIWNPTL